MKSMNFFYILTFTFLAHCAISAAFTSSFSSPAFTRTTQQEKNIFSSHLISSRKRTQLTFGRDEDPDKENVNVNEVPNVDAVTLTALGFGAIAFNFFVLANAGDGGIGGIVARLINTFQ